MQSGLKFFRRIVAASLGVALIVSFSAASAAAEAAPNSGDVVGPLSRITFGGRAAIGVIGGQDSGGYQGTAYPKPSFAMPDVKLDVNYAITPNVTGRVRLNLDNATTAGGVDRLYINVRKIADRDWLNLRVGLGRIAFGECGDLNNPIDDWFVTPTAGNVCGTDEGAILFGTFAPGARAFGAPVRIGYDFGLYNGERGVMPDRSSVKAASGRLRFHLGDAFFVSGSYFNSPGIAAGTRSALDIARTRDEGLGNAPAGAADWWDREAWEFDAQWRFAVGNPAALAGNRWSRVTDGLGAVSHSGFMRANYGRFTDDPRRGAAKRRGDHWSIQGVYNVTPAIYLGASYSEVELDGAATALLNPVVATNPAANSYARTTVVLGYNLTERTTLKAEYNWNRAKPVDIKDDHWALLLTTYF